MNAKLPLSDFYARLLCMNDLTLHQWLTNASLNVVVLIFMLEKLGMLEFYYFFNLFCECRIWLFDVMNLRSFCLFCLRYTSWSWVWFEYSNKDFFLQNSVGIHYFCSVFAVEGKYCPLIFILLPVGLIGLIFLLFRLQLFCICLYGPAKYIQLQS